MKSALEAHGIMLAKWEAQAPLHNHSTQEEILAAYNQ